MMYRSASTNRVLDNHFKHHSSPTSSKKLSRSLRALSLETKNLPMYGSLSEVSKKERGRAKFSENAIHLIPLVLLLCALVLWFLSNPDIDLPMRGTSIAERIEGLTLQGDINRDGSQTGNLLEFEDLDSTKQQHGDLKIAISDKKSL